MRVLAVSVFTWSRAVFSILRSTRRTQMFSKETVSVSNRAYCSWYWRANKSHFDVERKKSNFGANFLLLESELSSEHPKQCLPSVRSPINPSSLRPPHFRLNPSERTCMYIAHSPCPQFARHPRCTQHVFPGITHHRSSSTLPAANGARCFSSGTRTVQYSTQSVQAARCWSMVALRCTALHCTALFLLFCAAALFLPLSCISTFLLIVLFGALISSVLSAIASRV